MRKFKLKSFAIVLSLAAATCTFAAINNTYAMDNSTTELNSIGSNATKEKDNKNIPTSAIPENLLNETKSKMKTSKEAAIEEQPDKSKPESEIVTAVNTKKADEITDNKSEQTSKTEEKKDEPKQDIITSSVPTIEEEEESKELQKLTEELLSKESQNEQEYENFTKTIKYLKTLEEPKQDIITAVAAGKNEETINKIKNEFVGMHTYNKKSHQEFDRKIMEEYESQSKIKKDIEEFERAILKCKKRPYESKPKSEIATAVATEKEDEKIINKNAETSKMEEQKKEPKQNIITAGAAGKNEETINKIKNEFVGMHTYNKKSHQEFDREIMGECESQSKFKSDLVEDLEQCIIISKKKANKSELEKLLDEPKQNIMPTVTGEETNKSELTKNNATLKEKLDNDYYIEYTEYNDEKIYTLFKYTDNHEKKHLWQNSSREGAMLIYKLLKNKKNNDEREKEIENLKNKKRYDLYNGFYYYSFNNEDGKEIHALFGNPRFGFRFATAHYLGEYDNYDYLMKAYKYLNEENLEENLKEIKKEEKENRKFIFADGSYYTRTIDENRTKALTLFDSYGNILGNYHSITELVKARSKFKKIQKNKKSNKEI